MKKNYIEMEPYQLQNFIWCVFNEPKWAEEWMRRLEKEGVE